VIRRIGVVSIALAVVLAVVAVGDHRAKTARSNRAERAEWYCTYRGTLCGGPSSVAIERQWNRREIDYAAAFGVLGAVAAGSLVASGRRRLRLESPG
jgi:hypothetical protein